MPIDSVHAEKVKFKSGDNGRDRYKKNAVRFRNKFHKELRTVSKDIDGEYHGLVSFPIYGEAGIKVLERLRERALRLYGRCDVTSLIKAFYYVMIQTLDTGSVFSTAAVDFDIADSMENKVEKTWEVAR